MPKRIVVKAYQAVGGPVQAQKAQGDPYTAGPTDPGEYRVAYCGRHSSRAYPDWSKIPWGSELKEEKGGIFVKHKGRWTSLKSLTPVTKADILSRHEDLYGTRVLPKTWVFNDFGHMTCYFYKDKNRNMRFDPKAGERIHAEYFHTTPDDEAATSLGQPVVLSESHGCIHLKPTDINEMIKDGYMKRGNKVVVHPYGQAVPKFKVRPGGRRPYELHFYPGSKTLLITGTAP